LKEMLERVMKKEEDILIKFVTFFDFK